MASYILKKNSHGMPTHIETNFLEKKKQQTNTFEWNIAYL